ncbi:hypothetical protein AVEN_269997-1, partial [Araneus ventricosus]
LVRGLKWESAHEAPEFDFVGIPAFPSHYAIFHQFLKLTIAFSFPKFQIWKRCELPALTFRSTELHFSPGFPIDERFERGMAELKWRGAVANVQPKLFQRSPLVLWLLTSDD